MNRKQTLIFAIVFNVGLLLCFTIFWNRGHQDQLQAPSEQTLSLAELQRASRSEDENLPTRQPGSDPYNALQDARSGLEPPEGQYLEITARKGDKLERLALGYGTTSEEIIRFNRLSTTDLYPGQVLKIPMASEVGNSSIDALAKKGESDGKELVRQRGEQLFYTVKKGDTPWDIAEKHRIELQELLRLNDLNEKKARRLQVGDRLKVA